MKMKFRILKKPDLSRYAPPGQSLCQERKVLITGLTLASLWSLSFFGAYSNAYRELFDFYTKELIPGVMIPCFLSLIGTYTMIGFPILAVCMLCFAAYHYSYFWQGSKSIYLMRRLKSSWELHRRCLTLPVLSAAAALLWGGVLLALYFGCYCLFTPNQCLPPLW